MKTFLFWFSIVIAAVILGQSCSASLPVLIFCSSTRPSELISRIASCSAGISIENTATGLSPLIATCSARFIAKVVLPIDGRPATMMRSEGCSPLVFSSRSAKPVSRPVTVASDSNRCVILSIAPARTWRMSWKPVALLALRSAIANTRVSASSRRSLLVLPSGSKAESAISLATAISERSTDRSRTISA